MLSAEAAVLRESRGTRLSDLEDCFRFLQMEKDETVSDCSPHIANIGRLVEVSGPPGLGFASTARDILPLKPVGQFPGLLPSFFQSYTASGVVLPFFPGLVFSKPSNPASSRFQLSLHSLCHLPNACSQRALLRKP